MKKVVLKLDLHDDKAKQKAMKAVSHISGVDSIIIDMKDGKLTVTGDVDPVVVVGKLRKSGWHAELLTVGPAKEEPKKEDKKNNINPIESGYYNPFYNPNYMTHHHYQHVPSPDNRNDACVIC